MIFFRTGFLLVFFKLSYGTAFGQTRVESISQRLDTNQVAISVPVPKKDTFNLFKSAIYKVTADGQFASGNVNRVLTVFRGFLDYQSRSWEFSLNPNYLYGFQNNNLAEDDWLVNFSTSFLPKDKVYSLGFALVERSHLRSIYLRWQAGLGPAINLINTTQHRVNLNSVIMFEQTEFYEGQGFKTVRNSIRLKGRHAFFKSKVRLVHESYIQPSILDVNNYRLRTMISLEMPIHALVSIRATIQDSYDNVVFPGKQRNDFQFTFGLAFGNQF
ncbi:MAG: DUF481 domain-containing protein [Cytophagales bacterium]|nr:DUF481 domain-containing protein [Cytophagales bacterium]